MAMCNFLVQKLFLTKKVLEDLGSLFFRRCEKHSRDQLNQHERNEKKKWPETLSGILAFLMMGSLFHGL